MESYDEILAIMADAMLDPALKGPPHYRITLPSGNVIRKQVLLRALDTAKHYGWELRPIKDGSI